MDFNSDSRLLKAAELFKDGKEVIEPFMYPNLRDLMSNMEKLRNKQLCVWWDANTLHSYIAKNMIPRGLRIKKVPSAKYSEDFIVKWNEILSECSLNLMRLLVEQEKTMLRDISVEIQTVVTALTPFQVSAEYTNLKTAMDDNLTKLEELITETKKEKFNCDNADYKSNQVYSWHENAKRSCYPRSILKRDQYNTSWRSFTSSPRVSFLDSERSPISHGGDTMEEVSDIPEEV